MDGSKYKSNIKSYYNGIRKTSDDICREYGLSIIDPELHKKSLTYIDWLNLQKGDGTNRDRIREDIDQAVAESFSYGEFLVTMEEMGYDIKQGEHVAFRPTGKERFARGYNLGRGYSEDEIRARISDSPQPPVSVYNQQVYKMQAKYKKNRYIPDVERRYLWMMYQLGLVGKRQAPPKVTKHLKAELDKLDKYKEQQHFLKIRNLNKESEFFVYFENLEKDIGTLREKLTGLNAVKERKRQLFNALHDRAYYKKAHELFSEGYEMMKQESDKYLKAVNTLKAKGLSTSNEIAALEAEKSGIYQQIADVKKQLRAIRKEKRVCSNIIKTMELIDEKHQLIEERKQTKERGNEKDERRK